jgi:hypothetical protein
MLLSARSAVSAPRPLPWRKPRRELLVLALVAVAALAPVYKLNAQDNSRLCLSQALVHGRLSNDSCFGLDHALYKGNEYTDKAPGLSIVELPLAEALRLPPANTLPERSWKIWVIRLLTSGIVFVALAFVVGRVSEGLAPGFGSIALVTFALGTLIAPFAAMNFDQVPAAALGFGAFLLAWRRKPFAAGLLAGAGVFFEYQAGGIMVVVGAYLYLTTRSGRALARYVAGSLPGLVALAAYDWAAFGAPWRLSYRYVDNLYQPAQAGGLFGIHLPSTYAAQQVFIGRGGLLVATPVLVVAAWGLGLLWRAYRAEVAACIAVIAIFVVLNGGYFLPYGGTPGPRFLLPALPFLALGLGPAFARAPRLTAVLAFVSIASMTAISLDWYIQTPMKGGIFGEVGRIPFQLGSSRYVQGLEFTVFDWALPGRAWGAALVGIVAIGAFFLAYRAIPEGQRRPTAPARQTRWVTAFGVGAVVLVVVAQASAVSGYPYAGPPRDLTVSIQKLTPRIFPGQEADFAVWSSNSSDYQGYGKVVLTIVLPPGAALVGAPSYERGSGCAGTATIVCRLDSLSPRMTTPVRFGIRPSQFGAQQLEALLSAQGLSRPRRATLTLNSG